MHHSDSQADNLFSRLFSYAPRGDREAIEDYCTEALAWCLRNSPAFASELLKLLKKCGVPLGGEKLSLVHTQNSFSGTADEELENEEDLGAGRFDLVLESRGDQEFVIVIESKIGSGFREGQLAKYKQRLNSESFEGIPNGNRYLVTLTTTGERNVDTHADIKWSDVQPLLECADNSKPGQHVAETMKQFASFLKERGLALLKLMRITPELLNQWSPVKTLEAQLTLIVEKLRNKTEIKKLTGRKKVRTRNSTWIEVPGANGFLTGFGIGQIGKDCELFIWIEIVFDGNRLDLVKSIPRTLVGWFSSASMYLKATQETNYANSNGWDRDANSTPFAFSKTVDQELNGNADAIFDSLYEASKAVIEFREQNNSKRKAKP